jgi:hypothetical protein
MERLRQEMEEQEQVEAVEVAVEQQFHPTLFRVQVVQEL